MIANNKSGSGIENLYDYSRDSSKFNLHTEQMTNRWIRYRVDFPTAKPTSYPEYNTARGDYFVPHKRRNGSLAVLLHGWGDNSVIPCRLLASALVRMGTACFILYLPFHSSRMPPSIKARITCLNPEEWLEINQISVINVQQVVDWAGNSAGLNSEQTGVVGISFGGFISAITMGVDTRIKAGVFLVSGGNSEKIGRKSRISAIGKRYQRSEAEYNQIQSSYASYLTEVAKKGLQNVTPERKNFLADPMTYARYLQQRKVFMINALWDEFIPKEATIDFWQACGKPPIMWLPATHTTIWLYYPVIRQKIAHFLRKNLIQNPMNSSPKEFRLDG